MEVAAAQSFSSSLPSFFHGGIPKTSTVSYQSIHSWASKRSLPCPLQHNCASGAPQIHRRRSALALASSASASASPKSVASEADASTTDIWLLDPIGDGDWSHIGFKVARPGSYEIVSSSVTVGRVPDKADLVIPVATVSGLHAKFEKRQGNLYVSDLGSTNGTYVNEKRLNPGEVFPVQSGSRITFGDTNLAIFLVSKIEKVRVREEAQKAGGESAEKEGSPDAQQTETA